MLSQCLDRIYYIGPLPSRVRYYDVPLGSRRRADWSGHHRSVLQPTLFPAFNRCKTDIVVIVPTSEQSLSRASAESGPIPTCYLGMESYAGRQVLVYQVTKDELHWSIHNALSD